MTTHRTRISCSIDLLAEGKHQGFLTLPYSRNDSAWGSFQIPITVICGGDGPTILFTAGSHGDEYEGPVALMKLGMSLKAEQVNGRVIILPMMNYPAVLSGTRLSPADGLNMNRVFPGDWNGTPTRAIAHYVYRYLVPHAHVVVDIHSGGKTLDFVPSAVMHQLDDPMIMDRTMKALLAFGAPVGIVIKELDAEGMLDDVVEALGTVFISTELGGAGMATRETVAVADRGVRNLLCHFGVLAEKPVPPEEVGRAPTRLVHTPDPRCFVVSHDAGMFELLVDLGAAIEEGQPLARVHHFEDIGREPTLYPAPVPGILYGRHVPGLIKRGDCMAVIAVEYGPG